MWWCGMNRTAHATRTRTGTQPAEHPGEEWEWDAAEVAARGETTARWDKDWTVKVDVSGLRWGVRYHFAFNTTSPSVRHSPAGARNRARALHLHPTHYFFFFYTPLPSSVLFFFFEFSLLLRTEFVTKYLSLMDAVQQPTSTRFLRVFLG